MKKIVYDGIIVGSFVLLFRNIGKIIQKLYLPLILFYGAAFYLKDKLNSLNPNTFQNFTLIESVGLAILGILLIISGINLCISMIHLTFTKKVEPVKFFGLGFGGLQVKILISSVILMAIIAAPIALDSLIHLLKLGISGFDIKLSGSVMLLSILTLYLSIRLFFLVPAAVHTNTLGLSESWSTTKGNCAIIFFINIFLGLIIWGGTFIIDLPNIIDKFKVPYTAPESSETSYLRVFVDTTYYLTMSFVATITASTLYKRIKGIK
tara:strand:- start:8860 stop:9654 length:795 start_codon:yes stop_codon:yes gene_type:complete